jgi:hypothetical protein
MRKIGSVPIFLLLLATLAARAEERVLRLDNGETVEYRLVTDGKESAKPVAAQILRHLAAGELEEAALLSNAPRRRFEILREYRARVGDEEFRRVYGEYLKAQDRVIAEVAIGSRRLIIWNLGEARQRIAGQYYVAVDGKFLMDDVPSNERAKLQRILQAHRAEKLTVDPSRQPLAQ